MTFKVKVIYTNSHDETLKDGDWDTYYKSCKYPEYTREFDTHEQMALFILDLAKETKSEVIVPPSPEEDGTYEIEVYNDYRE